AIDGDDGRAARKLDEPLEIRRERHQVGIDNLWKILPTISREGPGKSNRVLPEGVAPTTDVDGGEVSALMSRARQVSGDECLEPSRSDRQRSCVGQRRGWQAQPVPRSENRDKEMGSDGCGSVLGAG